MQHKAGTHQEGNIIKVGADIRNGWMPPRDTIERIAFVAAFPPCDHLAVSGSRWFKGKGLRKLALSIDLFATAAELCEWIGAPYMIENPVGLLRHQPFMRDRPRRTIWYCRYGDHRAKPTDLWSNMFRDLMRPNGWEPRPQCYNGNRLCKYETKKAQI